MRLQGGRDSITCTTIDPSPSISILILPSGEPYSWPTGNEALPQSPDWAESISSQVTCMQGHCILGNLTPVAVT